MAAETAVGPAQRLPDAPAHVLDRRRLLDRERRGTSGRSRSMAKAAASAVPYRSRTSGASSTSPRKMVRIRDTMDIEGPNGKVASVKKGDDHAAARAVCESTSRPGVSGTSRATSPTTNTRSAVRTGRWRPSASAGSGSRTPTAWRWRPARTTVSSLPWPSSSTISRIRGGDSVDHPSLACEASTDVSGSTAGSCRASRSARRAPGTTA